MIELHDKIDPDFTVKMVADGEEREINFRELLNRKTVVSVYMKNNTPGCDRQTRSLAGHADWFNEQNINLVALSRDTCGSHKKYAKKQGINFTLVSDPEFKFAAAVDALVQKKMFGKTFTGPSRSAFVIDTDGTILGIIKKIDTKNHAEELKALIGSL